VLALKYRPKSFDELVGQESVSKSLKIALESDSLGNAYLFSGLRGSGKTSSARIFSKTVLCETSPTATPCEVCDSCRMANSGSHLDIIEMDGASNRGIDKIRELIEQTHYKPTTGRFKIFIIDEVHMLTKEAFNALLKTLEEPPEYIKFILATTDPLKLPPTILSRTQHFSFKRIDKSKVIEHISKILTTEKIAFEESAVEVIARSGNGSLRDTLTLLEQAIIYGEKSLKLNAVTDMLGLLDPELLNRLFTLLSEDNREAIIEIARELESYEAELVIDEMIQYLKDQLILGSFPVERIGSYFETLNSSKQLLFSGADNGFILLLTLLKMNSYGKSGEKIVERVVERVVEKPTATSVSDSSPQIAEQTKTFQKAGQEDNLQIRFNTIIMEAVENVREIVEKGFKMEYLTDCWRRHFRPLSLSGGVFKIEFQFGADESSGMCRKWTRLRHQDFVEVVKRLTHFRGKPVTVEWIASPDNYTPPPQEEVKKPPQQPKKLVENGKSLEKESVDAEIERYMGAVDNSSFTPIESSNQVESAIKMEQPYHKIEEVPVKPQEKSEVVNRDNYSAIIKDLFRT
jgi:DNA polymerase-3 subunit gamma/tau